MRLSNFTTNGRISNPMHVKGPTERKETITESFISWQNRTQFKKILFTCEHASNRLPDPYKWGSSEVLKNQHWGIDIGAEDLTRKLASHFKCDAIIANVSRLLIDYNRPVIGKHSDTLIREVCDGLKVDFNQNLSKEERQSRIDRFYHPYRQKFEEMANQQHIEVVISVHSYTDVYEGKKRDVEMGVLYRDESLASTALAQKVCEKFKILDYDARLNEPWTGDIMDVIYQAHTFGKKSFAIEFRQDLLQNPKYMEKLFQHFVHVLESLCA